MSKVISLTELTITYHHQLRPSQVERVLPGQRVCLKVLQAVELGLNNRPVTPVHGDVLRGGEDEGAGVSLSVAAQDILSRSSNVARLKITRRKCEEHLNVSLAVGSMWKQ